MAMPHHRVFSDDASGMALRSRGDCDRKSREPLGEGRKFLRGVAVAVESICSIVDCTLCCPELLGYSLRR